MLLPVVVFCGTGFYQSFAIKSNILLNLLHKIKQSNWKEYLKACMLKEISVIFQFKGRVNALKYCNKFISEGICVQTSY